MRKLTVLCSVVKMRQWYQYILDKVYHSSFKRTMNRLSDLWEIKKQSTDYITKCSHDLKPLMVIPGRNGITRWFGSSCPDSTGNFSSKECLKNTRDIHYHLMP